MEEEIVISTNNGEELSQEALPKKITKEDFHNLAVSKKGKILYWSKTVILLLISTFLVSFSAYCLITPNNFTIGGASGIAILLNVAFNIPQSIVLFGINFPLIVLAFFFVKKKFAILSASHIGLQTLWLIIFENAFPNFEIRFAESGEKIFAALASGICIGVAIALAFKIGGSTGGADILAVIIQKKCAATSIAWMIFTINCIIIGSSIFVFYDADNTIAYNLLPIMMSAFEAYIDSKTNDSLTNGFHSAIEFRIITVKPDEMAKCLMKELSRGVTALPAVGMYTKENRTMLLCVINRRQVATLKRVMKSVDPDSFAVMSNVSQVLGLGFFSGEM